MMMLISAVTTSVIINVITILIATATPVESSSSDSSSTGDIKIHIIVAMYVCMYILKHHRISRHVPESCIFHTDKRKAVL